MGHTSLREGGGTHVQTPSIKGLRAETANCLKEEANNVLGSQRPSVDSWGLGVLLQTVLMRRALHTLAKAPMGCTT